MGPYIFANAALSGFFAFGAIYHFILWSRSRREWTLLAFALVSFLSSVNAYAVLSIATAHTVVEGQQALNLRGHVAGLSVISLAWLFSSVSGVRARLYLWIVTTVLLAGVLAGLTLRPSTGIVTSVVQVVMPWGEQISSLQRLTPSPFLPIMYVMALSVPIFGLFSARRVGARDRVGGVLLALTSVGSLASVFVGLTADLAGTSLPYLGPVVSAVWILPVAWQVARANRQQADQLVTTERRFRAIFDQTFQFIGLLSVDGTLLEVNETALAFAGAGQADVIGKKFWDTPWWTHSPELQGRLRAAVHRAGHGDVVRFEVTHRAADGRLHHVDFSLKPVRDGDGAVVMLIPEGHDISERKEAEDALRRSEERFRFLIQNQTEFVVSCRPDATLIFVNESYCRYFGTAPDVAIGTSLLDRIAPEHREAMRGQIAGVTRDTPVCTGEHIVVTGADERRWTQWTSSGVFDDGRQLIALQFTGRDIDARVVAEDGKRKLEQRLLQAQKMEALGQLAGGVAHDFNNLLTVIAGHTDMLLAERDTTPARHDLEQIRLATERAASMTRQLLAFSRQSVLEPKVVNLNTIVEQAETMLRRTLGEDIELSVRTASDVDHVMADPDQLGRVLLNMAINARDAMPDGGTLVIETRNVTLQSELVDGAEEGPPGAYVLLAMSDTGCGMTSETKARLFEPFYTTKGLGKGTGLGLSVVDGVVKQSGGRIDVHSQPGLGTTFNIYLPATAAAAAGDPIRSDARTLSAGTETILLVEDEPAVREMTQAALQRRGYTVLPASSGAEALEIARDNPGRIDLVLTDVVMPGMSGPQLVERLRAEHPVLAAVFMSGYTSDAVLRHGIETGEADFLQKPFSTAALAAKLRQVLDRP
ncbi:MAG TPA: PAS domain S-box protein [Vicinamibacterales bacterium]|nr:PAS domain S-box protein [Vicinamibacterales bacterium]